MFLHERTRKSICRYSFVALCLLPTCAVAIWAASRTTETYRNLCAAELGSLLRLKVILGGIEHPEPGATRYTNIVLADPETDSPILRAEKIDAYATKGALAIVAPKLTIESSAAGALAELLHNRMRDRTESGEIPIRLYVGELTMASPIDDVTLLELRAHIEPTSEGRGAHFTFRTAEMAKDAEPVALTIVRFRTAKTGFKLYTQGAFQDSAGKFEAVVQLLRTLVADNQVVVPVSPEAEDLLRVQ